MRSSIRRAESKKKEDVTSKTLIHVVFRSDAKSSPEHFRGPHQGGQAGGQAGGVLSEVS
jgi:hypothetical protein